MGTKQNTRDTQKIDCKTCGREYSPMCEYQQGRCPYHPAMINLSAVKTRFTKLINFFKGL
jgi:hypothetical protein